MEKNVEEQVFDSSSSSSHSPDHAGVGREQAQCSDGNQISKFPDKWSSLEVCYSDIVDATNGLSETSMIGKGGYGSVYKGKLGRKAVAIKMLDSTSKQGQKEFFQELEVLYQMMHPHLVKLVGACFEVRALVYEYLPHGSLEDFFKENPSLLTWQMRTRIIYEICVALIYLHSKSVVHGDLKPANILLDANFRSKLSDFGLCRFLPKDMTSSVYLETIPKGTSGYIDPWFLETWILRPGSDLYSFGITILKLLTGLPPIGLGIKARDADENMFREMIDRTAGSWPFELAKELLFWSLQCCYHNDQKSLGLLKDMSTCLEEMLAEIETLQEGGFKVAMGGKRTVEVEDMNEEPEVIVVVRIHMHNESYAQEIKDRILRMKGVQAAETELEASLVSVNGVFDPSKLVEYVYRMTGKRALIMKVQPVVENDERIEPGQPAPANAKPKEMKMAEAVSSASDLQDHVPDGSANELDVVEPDVSANDLEEPELDASANDDLDAAVLDAKADNFINRFKQQLKLQWAFSGSDHVVKEQGDGWLLTVALIEGTNLAAVDSSGYSDPYVVFSCNGKTKTSSIKFQAPHPRWNEIFEFDAMEDPPSVMDVNVYDFDGPFDEAVSLGHAEVNFIKSNLSDLADVWILLERKLAQACQSKLHLRVFLNNTRGSEVVTEYQTKVKKEINVRSLQMNSTFQKIFGLPPEESLINDFTCHLKRKLPLQGRLFISPRIIGFYTNLFGHDTKFFFLWEDIEDIQVADIQVAPSSLTSMSSPGLFIILRRGRGLDAKHGAKSLDQDGRLKFHFQSFVSFGIANRTIMALWKARSLSREQKIQIVEDESEDKTLHE